MNFRIRHSEIGLLEQISL